MNITFNHILFCLILGNLSTYAQTISGTLSLTTNQEIKLNCFNGFQTYEVASVETDEHGSFQINYSKNEYGIAYLTTGQSRPFYIILCGENIRLIGESLNHPEDVYFTHGEQNLAFEKYNTQKPLREQALSAWDFLEKIYDSDSLFTIHYEIHKTIKNEKKRIRDEDSTYIAKLPQNSIVSWFIPMRNLLSSVPNIAEYQREKIPATISIFRSIDYTDDKLFKSGLLKQTIESHYWLIENCGKSLDSVYIEMNKSIDFLIDNLNKDADKLNEITGYLFNLLERHSLFIVSEHLALKILNEVSCTVNADLAIQLETYRAMKKGNIAPEINFPHRFYPDSTFQPQNLSEINSPYKLVVFGASWCPNCSEEIPNIAKAYPEWKSHGLEVLFVSLDEDKNSFFTFASHFPFISISDYKGWESPIAKAYYVFATPTMYLLDNNNKILLRPHSVNQINDWVEWYLIKGNPLPNE